MGMFYFNLHHCIKISIQNGFTILGTKSPYEIGTLKILISRLQVASKNHVKLQYNRNFIIKFNYIAKRWMIKLSNYNYTWNNEIELNLCEQPTYY